MTLLRRVRSAALTLALLLTGGSAAAQVVPTSATSVRVGTPATLEIWNRPIIELRATIDEVTPAERVSRARSRIERLPLSADQDRILATPTTMGSVNGLFVIVGSRYVFAILPEDLDPESGLTLAVAGDSAVSRLTAALTARADQQRMPLILRGVALSLLATLLLVLLLRLIGRARKRALEHPFTTAVSQRATIFGVNLGEALTAIERAVGKLTAMSAIIVALYLWLTFVFAQFPFTEPWGRELGGYLRQLLQGFGSGILGAIPGLFAVVLIFLLTRVVTRALNRFFQSVESGQLEIEWLEPETAKATRRMVIVLVWIFAVVVAYPHIPGSETPVFKGISVMVGLMATLGSAGVVSHLVSGMVIVYSRSCKPGDFIKVGEIEGVVTVVGVLSTKIATRRRTEITVPNAVLVGTSITNYTRLAREDGEMITTTLTIGYDAPWRQVQDLLLLAAGRTVGLRKTPEPFVHQRSLSDFYVEYELMARIEEPRDRPEVLSRLHAQIQDAFNEAGVQIMSPHFEGQPDSKVWVPRSAWHGRPAGDA
jgi:small-conductance mechanosensitive channel